MGRPCPSLGPCWGPSPQGFLFPRPVLNILSLGENILGETGPFNLRETLFWSMECVALSLPCGVSTELPPPWAVWLCGGRGEERGAGRAGALCLCWPIAAHTHDVVMVACLWVGISNTSLGECHPPPSTCAVAWSCSGPGGLSSGFGLLKSWVAYAASVHGSKFLTHFADGVSLWASFRPS